MYIILRLPYVNLKKRGRFSRMDHTKKTSAKEEIKKGDAITVLLNKSLSLQFSASTSLNFMDLNF